MSQASEKPRPTPTRWTENILHWAVPPDGIVEIVCPHCLQGISAHCSHIGQPRHCENCHKEFLGKTTDVGMQKASIYYWSNMLGWMKFVVMLLVVGLVISAISSCVGRP